MKLFFQILVILLLLSAGAFLWEKASGIKNMFTQSIEVTQNIVLKEITTMGKLQLVNYQFKDVVESEVKKTLFPDARALLIISGQAVGCIDLTKIQVKDINQQKDSLFIRLPAPEICVNKVDHSQSKVYDLSMFSVLDQSVLIDEAYKKAEEKINDSAIQMGILDQTKTNANLMLKPILEKVSGKKVAFFW